MNRIGFVSVSPTVDTNPYAAGDLVGPKLSFDLSGYQDWGGCILDSVRVVDLAKQSADLDLVLFDQDPSGTTFTDNAALAIADADMTKIIGVAQVATWIAFADNSVGFVRALGIPLWLPATRATLYGAMVTRATPTYGANDIRVQLGLRRP